MTSYTTLIGAKSVAGSILNWTNVTRVDPATCLAFAEASLIGGMPIPGTDRSMALRVREMLVTSAIALAQNASTAPLPTRFLDPVGLRDDTNNGYLTNLPQIQMLGHRSYDENGDLYTGTPEYFSIYNELINFEVAAEAATDYTILFFQRPAPLSGSNETNFLTDRYPQMLFWCACAYAFDFDGDRQKYADYMGRVIGLLKAANAESDLTLRGAMFGNEVPG